MRGCFCDVKTIMPIQQKIQCVCYWKRYKIQRQSITTMPFLIFPYNSNDQKQVEGNYMAKSLCSAMQECISDLAGRSFISCDCMKMGTAIVKTFATSASLTVRAVKFVVCSRLLCGNNGNTQQLQFKVFFTIPWLLDQINEQVLTNL